MQEGGQLVAQMWGNASGIASHWVGFGSPRVSAQDWVMHARSSVTGARFASGSRMPLLFFPQLVGHAGTTLPLKEKILNSVAFEQLLLGLVSLSTTVVRVNFGDVTEHWTRTTTHGDSCEPATLDFTGFTDAPDISSHMCPGRCRPQRRMGVSFFSSVPI